MFMRSIVCLTVTLTSCCVGMFASGRAQAQNPALMEAYGRGVHAYYSGRQAEAYDLLTMAIDSGLQDPRAFYFRGIVAAASGRPDEAVSDWEQGAALEAAGRMFGDIGRSLARVQGPTRIRLEAIRQSARLQAAAAAAARSEARYGEIRQAEGRVLRAPAAPAPPSAPPPAEEVDDNPFRDDDLAEVTPEVESPDALSDAMETAQSETEALPSPSDSPDAPGAEADAFGTGDGDPFGGEGDPFGGDADPFDSGGGDGGEDPFGGAGDDPFGGDPFGN